MIRLEHKGSTGNRTSLMLVVLKENIATVLKEENDKVAKDIDEKLDIKKTKRNSEQFSQSMLTLRIF